jgi:hypothetical protein
MVRLAVQPEVAAQEVAVRALLQDQPGLLAQQTQAVVEAVVMAAQAQATSLLAEQVAQA